MALIPLNIDLTTTWLDITDKITANFGDGNGITFLLHYEHTKTLEILTDTTGVAVIDTSNNDKGIKLDRYLKKVSTRFNADYKYYARSLDTIATLSIKDKGEAVSIEGVETDPIIKSIPITDTFHHLGHEGKVFIHSDRHDDVTTNLDVLIKIPAGDATRQVHMRFNYTANVDVGVLDVDVKLYKDTIVSNNGTPEVIFSTNDAIVKTTGVLMFEGPTIDNELTDLGTLKVQGLISGEKKSTNSKEQEVPEWILAPDGEKERNYLLRATVNGGATNIVNALFFYDSGAI